MDKVNHRKNINKVKKKQKTFVLERYKLLKLIQKETDNLNRPVMGEKTELVLKKR